MGIISKSEACSVAAERGGDVTHQHQQRWQDAQTAGPHQGQGLQAWQPCWQQQGPSGAPSTRAGDAHLQTWMLEEQSQEQERQEQEQAALRLRQRVVRGLQADQHA